MFQFLIRMSSDFDVTGENMIMDRSCYVKDKLVITLYLSGKAIHKTIVYDEEKLVQEGEEPCSLPTSVMEFQIDGKEYLLQGCSICKIIRGYELPKTNSKILFEGIFPNAMCKGPDGTIFVFDNTHKSLIQLRYCDGQFHLAQEFCMKCADVHSLCFSKNCGLVIALHSDRKTLTGFHFPTGQVTWKDREIQTGSSPQVQSILVLPDGRVCIFTHEEVFALNPVNGAFLYTLHHFHEPIITQAIAACYNGNQQKLAICTFPMKVTVYDVSFGPPVETSFLHLKGIVPDEEQREVFV